MQTEKTKAPILSDPSELAPYGILQIPVDSNWSKWADRLSQPTLDNMGFEDGEYAFYRNIMDEPDFPFEKISDSVAPAAVQFFGLDSWQDLELDDAFCVHYNTSQDDTSGAKHTDPSDVTVNLCLEKSNDTVGSQVLFYGSKGSVRKDDGFLFRVDQIPGSATVHWGGHPHETLPLEQGRRTNVILTFAFRDKGKSQANKRACYF